MSVVEFIIISLLFFYLGKYSNTQAEKQKIIRIKQQIKEKLENKPKPGVIPFKSSEEIAEIKNGTKAIEDAWDELDV